VLARAVTGGVDRWRESGGRRKRKGRDRKTKNKEKTADWWVMHDLRTFSGTYSGRAHSKLSNSFSVLFIHVLRAQHLRDLLEQL
jgi:hypothetical protein